MAEKIFQRGLLPFDPEKHARFKSAVDYGFTFAEPAYPIDMTGGLTNLGMGGNGPDDSLTVNGGQPCGDCGPNAVPKNVNQTTAAVDGVDYTALTSNQIVSLYFLYQAQLAGISWRPKGDDWTAPEGLDQGVDLGDWLLWLFSHDENGDEVAPGEGLVEGFVKLELSELDSALQLVQSVVVGVSLNPQADEQATATPPLWDVGPGDEPDPQEGHAIEFVRAESASGPFGWGSWGMVVPSTLAWKEKCPQQAFGVLTAEQAASKGFAEQFAAVVADLKALGGTVVTTPPDTNGEPPANPPKKKKPRIEEIVDEVVEEVEEVAREIFGRSHGDVSQGPTPRV